MIDKTNIFILLLLCSLGSIKAQDKEFKKEWNIGVSFGATLSKADFATSASESPLSTKMWQQFQGGISVRYMTEKHLGFIVEANYSQQGWEQDFKSDIPEVQSELDLLQHRHQLNYLEIPFLTHIYFGNKVRFFINLGPKIGLLLSEKETYNDELIAYLASGKPSAGMMTAQFFRKADRKFDYGIMVGGGLEFRTGIGHFALEGRYSFGLGDFFSNRKSDHFQRSANRVVGVKMTYYIKLF